MKLLLEHNADRSKGPKTWDGHIGTTPLYWAANKGFAKTAAVLEVAVLLERGANPNPKQRPTIVKVRDPITF